MAPKEQACAWLDPTVFNGYFVSSLWRPHCRFSRHSRTPSPQPRNVDSGAGETVGSAMYCVSYESTVTPSEVDTVILVDTSLCRILSCRLLPNAFDALRHGRTVLHVLRPHVPFAATVKRDGLPINRYGGDLLFVDAASKSHGRAIVSQSGRPACV